MARRSELASASIVSLVCVLDAFIVAVQAVAFLYLAARVPELFIYALAALPLVVWGAAYLSIKLTAPLMDVATADGTAAQTSPQLAATRAPAAATPKLRAA
jgi:hypothetical protein